jgi:hypothetical protein
LSSNTMPGRANSWHSRHWAIAIQSLIGSFPRNNPTIE